MTATLTVSEETQELQRDASKLAYTAIRFSGLWRELASEEWEALADKLGALAVGLIQSEINAELTRREAESRKLDEWLTGGVESGEYGKTEELRRRARKGLK